MTRASAIAVVASLCLLPSCTLMLLAPGSSLSTRSESAVRAVVVRDEGDPGFWLCVQLAAKEPAWRWVHSDGSPEATALWRDVDLGALPPPRAHLWFRSVGSPWCELSLRSREHPVHGGARTAQGYGEATPHATVREGTIAVELPGAEVLVTERASSAELCVRIVLCIAVDVGIVLLIVA